MFLHSLQHRLLTQYGIRFENNDQAKAFLYQMAEEVSRRLNAINMCGRSLTLKIMKRDPSAPVEAPKVSSVADTCTSILTNVSVVHGAWHL